jgi:hypothetical protein
MSFSQTLAKITALLAGRSERQAMQQRAVRSAQTPDTAAIVMPGHMDDAAPGAPQRGYAAGLSARTRRLRIQAAFDSSMPVEDRRGLAGRNVELDRLTMSVLEQDKHGLIIGARGSGKTSLARAFGEAADEAQNVVIYNSASGDIGFADLFRPYLQELSGYIGDLPRSAEYQRMMTQSFDARDMANLLTEHVRRKTIIIIDEFDRVQSVETKSETASMMKLLSDMRSKVRLVIIGIAANLEDLLEGHESLRRHMISLPIGSISSEAMHDLLGRCCKKAGLRLDPEGGDGLVNAAMGSPYHLRLFGLHAALLANRAESDVITLNNVQLGLTEALREWSTLSEGIASHMRALMKGDGLEVAPIVSACIIGAFKIRFNRKDIVESIIGLLDAPPHLATEATDAVLERLKPMLRQTSIAGQYMFADSLMPQFAMLMYNDNTSMTDDFRASESQYAEDHLKTVFNQRNAG